MQDKNTFKQKRSNSIKGNIKSKWITFGIIKSIHHHDKMYHTLKMTDPDSHNYLVLKINLDTYNKILKSNIRLQKNYIMKLASLNTKYKISSVNQKRKNIFLNLSKMKMDLTLLIN